MSTDEFMNRFLDGKTAPDPMRAAQASMRQDRPKRFYNEVGLVAENGGFALTLDGKMARTPARNRLSMPNDALAEAMADEWRRQVEVIDPATMPLTRLANVALDRVAAVLDEVRADMAKYAASDLLCYRADAPERLVEQQNALWNPVLAWAAQALGADFRLATGIVHVAQPERTQAAIAAALAGIVDPFRLTALHMVTTLTGSVLLALALDAQSLDAQSFDANRIWDAAHVDEDVQISIWGMDDEALARRESRRRDYDAAVLVIEQNHT